MDKALEVSRDKLFFGCKIEVTPWDSGLDIDDNEFRPLEADLDEYHPKATRTLFIGNLEKDVTSADLRQHFEGTFFFSNFNHYYYYYSPFNKKKIVRKKVVSVEARTRTNEQKNYRTKLFFKKTALKLL